MYAKRQKDGGQLLNPGSFAGAGIIIQDENISIVRDIYMTRRSVQGLLQADSDVRRQSLHNVGKSTLFLAFEY